MKIVAGGKKARNFGRSGGGGVRGGGGPAERPILDAPTKILITLSTDTPHHNTHHHTTQHNTTQHNNATQQQRHTTQHNGGSRTGGSWCGGFCREVLGGAGRSMAQKTRHEQQIPKSSPLAKHKTFFGDRSSKRWSGHKSGAGQKWSDLERAKSGHGPKVVWAKSGTGQKWYGPKVVIVILTG